MPRRELCPVLEHPEPEDERPWSVVRRVNPFTLSSPAESTPTMTPVAVSASAGGPGSVLLPPSSSAVAAVTTMTAPNTSANRFLVRRSTARGQLAAAAAPVPVLPGA